jgi:hypothetical protein
VTSPLATALGVDALLSLTTAVVLALLPAVWSDPIALAALMVGHLLFALRVLPVTRRCAAGARRAAGRAVVIARLGLVVASGVALGRRVPALAPESLPWLWGALAALSCAAAGYAWWRSPARLR